ncbi:OstA-like protein [Abyssalbus ytuae]|uniref:OstA-like protein n=1 Tax=Abyssalbus ytuae TaxID=2926907 RepID=A0A9E6ZPJ0_9FLAO|nr:OstA-like protein [Abyssalbus ytuae]UOB18180.1 OstA-like protein [Abyssalbus ytuae]
MRKIHILIFLVLNCAVSFSQETKKIDIVEGRNFSKDEDKYPGAAIFSKDNLGQVQFRHEGVDLWCDLAIYYQTENRIKAYGNIFFQQGDSIKMNSEYIEYEGDTKLAIARDKVVLRNNSTTLNTEELRFDRNIQEAYYDTFGTVKDSVNTLTSNKGRYYLSLKKYEFKSDVKVVSPDQTINSARMDYYSESKRVYMYGPSTVTGEDYKFYCERGFYDTYSENGYGLKNTRIDYNNRIIYGDSLYFDKTREFASATNNIKVIDTVNKGVVKGHYAEVYKAKDSVFVTKRAVAISLVEKDSLYIHGDTLMVTGKENARIIRAFHKARLFKTDLSGKCDSIHHTQANGITQMIKDPILWSGENQMTGDSIHLISSLETEKLDSLKVINNAFIIQKDSLSEDGYNQIKGKDLFGKFIDNELRVVDIVKNAELIYYLWNDKNEFIGIDKRVCGKIQFTLQDNQIDEVTSYIDVDGNIFPDDQLPVNSRKFRGFIWRGDERMNTVNDIFDEEDNIELVKIHGVDNPIDPDTPDEKAEEENRDLKIEEKKKDNSISSQTPGSKTITTLKKDVSGQKQSEP